MKGLARRLLAYEAAAGNAAPAGGPVAFRVCEKLRGTLGRNLGTGGLSALMARALALAGAEVPWLRALHLNTDGSVGGLDKLEAKLDARAVAEGEAALVAQLHNLLITFIGPALMLQLLREVWPGMDDLNF